MTNIHWSTQVSGDFNIADDWSTKTVPGPGDNAILDATGATAYTVTASTSETVNSIRTAATATLSITGGTFNATSGTGSGANRGAILVGGNTTLSVGGQLTNPGSIGLERCVCFVEGDPDHPLTVSGGGQVTLSDDLQNVVVGASANTKLINVDNTISGAGQFGDGSLILDNEAAGVIEATGVNALIVNTGAQTITNAGLIEATAAGGLTAQSMIANTGTLLARGGTLSAAGGLANLSGTTLTGGTYEADAGSTLELNQNAAIVTDKAWTILDGAGSKIQALDTTTGQEVGIETTLTTIDAAGKLDVLGGRSWTSSKAMSNAGTIDLGGGTFAPASLANTGTLAGFGTAASVVNDLGTVTASGGALTFTGAGDVFSGALNGGEIDFAGGTDAVNNGAIIVVAKWSISGGAAVTINGNLTYDGTFADGSATTLTVGAVGGGGALTLTGASTFAGAVNGSGTLAFNGGVHAIDGGATVAVAKWSITGGAAVTVGESLSYGGAYSQVAGTILTIGPGPSSLNLTGSASLSGTVNGAGTVKLSSATLGGLAVGGTVKLYDVGAADQTGLVTLGDASSNAATLSIGAGAVYRIDNDSGMAQGSSTRSAIKNSGLFVKSAGAGVSRIAVKISDNGTIEAASGTLDFTRAITGGGTMMVDPGATLETGSGNVSATLGMTFHGGSGTLALGAVAKFAATISGFDFTDTIDLVKTVATAATLGPGDTLVITNGAATVATLQLAGDFTGGTFNAASDGHGGTNITLAPGGAAAHEPPLAAASSAPAQRFAAAAAAWAASAASALTPRADWSHPPPMLLAPRAQMT